MSLLIAFVAAVLLSDGASVAFGAIRVEGSGGSAAEREVGTAPASLVNSSGSSGSTATYTSLKGWSVSTLCGQHSHQRCAVVFAVSTMSLCLVGFAVIVACIVRWRRCSSQGLQGWRHRDAVEANNDDAADASDYAAERTGLLVHADDRHSDSAVSEEGETAGAPVQGGRMARYVHRLNLRGTRLWTFLGMTPAGLFYGSSRRTPASQSSPTPPGASPSHRRGLHGVGGVATASGSDDAISGDGSWDAQRDAPHGVSAASSTGHSFLRGVISVATTTADSSESGNDSGRHSDDGNEVLHDGSDHRSVTCDRECLIVEIAENERGVRRSAVATLPPSSPITPHILPQLMHYNSNSSARADSDGGTDNDDEDDGGCFADITDSDSQQMGGEPAAAAAAGAAERTMRTSTSSMTASANSSGDSPSFLRVDSAGSVSHLEPSAHDGAADSSTSPVRFPHVDTAIFDASTMSGGVLAVAGAGGPAAHIVTVDASVVNALFEPDHFPRASSHHSGSDAHLSSPASHVSLADCCYTHPPLTSGTATPTSTRRSGSCNALPHCVAPAVATTTTTAVLPVNNSLSDGLDMEGEAVVDDFDTTQQSRSYVPTAQQQQHQRQPQLQPQPAAVMEPAQPETVRKSSRRTRSDSYYSEPWQPILVQSTPSQLATAAAASLPVVAVPVSSIVQMTTEPTLCNALSPPSQPQPQPKPQQQQQRQPPRCPMHTDLCGELEDELDDLMLDEEASAQSNRTGESGHIFSGSSTSTSRTVTPATETDPESIVGTPTMFCAAALANGGRSVGPAFLTVSPPASACIPLHPESPPVAIFARTVGAGGNFFGRDGDARGGTSPTLASCSVGRRPLNLSVEERTLLMKSRKWLFPLIDGADEIESSVIGEGEGAEEQVGDAAPVKEAA